MATVTTAEALADLTSTRGLDTETIHNFGITFHESSQTYRYRDDEWPDNTIRMKSFNGSGKKYSWAGHQKGGECDLYGLSQAMEIVSDDLLYLVEGEPDVWTMRQAGLPAVTFTTGAPSVPEAGAKTLADTGLRIHVIYDHDPSGRRGSQKVARKLMEYGTDVTVLKLPEHLPDKADITDLYKNCGDNALFREIVRSLDEVLVDHRELVATTTGDERKPETLAGLSTLDDLSSRYDAQRFVALHGDNLHFVMKRDEWIIFSPEQQRWQFDSKGVLVNGLAMDVGQAMRKELGDFYYGKVKDKEFILALKYVSKEVESSRGISGFVRLARSLPNIPIEVSALDTNPWLLGVRNGVVDLRTGELRPADPADLMTKQCPVVYDPKAEAPRWHQCLEEWHPNPEDRSYLQRHAGLALIGEQREHVFLIHFGDGRNGKGTFTRALQYVLGEYATVIDHSLLVKTNKQEHPTVRAKLFGALLAVAFETDAHARLSEASIKNLVGNDMISARGMGENFWEFTPRFSLWLQTNHLPQFTGRDRGFLSRVKVMPWGQNFEGERGDADLDEALRAEASGILRWAVEGCLEYLEIGLSEPKAVQDATLRYQESQNQIAHFIEQAGLWFHDTASIRASTLKEVAEEWAKETGINERDFLKDLNTYLKNDMGLKQKQVRSDDRKRSWFGVGLK